MTINVYPGASNPSHELSLSDGVQTWGVRLDGGPEALREQPQTPSTVRLGAPAGFGAWEPRLAQIEQRDWSGGRGQLFFSAEDRQSARRFSDSMNAWTLTPGVLLPAPQWKLARGLRHAVQHLPGSLAWRSLIGETRLLAAGFHVTSAFTPARARLWLRRVGAPEPLLFRIVEDDSGEPGAAVADSNASLSIAEVGDIVSIFHSFELTQLASSLDAGGDYHLVLTGSPLDNAANHWEVGVDAKRAGHQAADNPAWQVAGFSPYFRVEDAGISRSFHFFHFAGGFYAADRRANGTPSRVYLNGDRGLATGGAATRLEDADKAWPVDQWAGAWVRILRGKGEGQARRIQSNSSYELFVAAWDNAPNSTSEYAVYATDLWQDVSPATGDLIDGVISDVAVVNDHALLAQGAAVPVLRMRYNTAIAVPLHEFDDDGTNMADLIHGSHHPEFGPQVWRGQAAACEISRAAPTAWATALSFGAAIKVGDKSQPLRSLFEFESLLGAVKTDGLWSVADNDRAERREAGLESLAHPGGWDRKPPICTFGGALLLGWGHRLLRFEGGAWTQLGVAELPTDRSGAIAALQPLGAARLAVAIDAGEGGVSSVLVFNGEAWHEILRAPQAGLRITALGLQPNPGTHPRLWMAMGGDMAYLDLLADEPVAGSDLAYQHEAVVELSAVDMGAARLPKFLKELSLLSHDLGGGRQVDFDYQLDGEIGGPRWRPGGAFYSSPLDTLALNAGQIHMLRTRLRLHTSHAHAPCRVHAVVLEGFARTPLKYEWTLRVRLAELQLHPGGGLDAPPGEFLAWLQQAARQARKIHMRSVWKDLDDKFVIVEPPSAVRNNTTGAGWSGSATVVLREA